VVRAAGTRVLSGPLDATVARRAGALDGRHLASDSRPGLGPADEIARATGFTENQAVVPTDGDLESVDGLQSNAIEFDTGERNAMDEETRRPRENTPRNTRRGLRHF
jgi:hypothetical protein